jgi:predicted ATPase
LRRDILSAAGNRPLVIDQPDDNLDNLSVYPSLVEYFRKRKKTRQIIIITHNPNLVVNTDAEQVIVANFDGSQRHATRVAPFLQILNEGSPVS